MRQVWIPRAGPPEVLQVRTAPDPTPKPTEVRIRTAACGVNFADVLMRRGLYPDAPALPAVPGFEVTGVVDSAGDLVREVRPGQRVIGFTRFGGYSDTVCVPEDLVFPLPDSLDLARAAALPVQYTTAYQMLIVMGGLRAGERVLVHSAGGGVGLAVADIARIVGAEVIGVASASKHAFLRDRGWIHLIDRRSLDIVAEVQRLTGGRGVNLALDPIGGRSWHASYRCLGPTGRLIVYGVADTLGPRRGWARVVKVLLQQPWLRFHPLRLMSDNKGVLGVNLGHLWDSQELIRGWMKQILEWHAAGRLSPWVDRTYPFDEAPAAHRRLEDRANLGKVLLCS